MSIQYSVRGNYLRGVNNLVGKGIVTGKMKNFVLYASTDKARSVPEAYYLLTRELIERMSSNECKLSDNVRRALSEAISIKLWEDFSSYYIQSGSMMDENYVQRYAGEILMNNMGVRETAIISLKSPDLLGNFFDSIPYKGETFLSYFSRELDAADKQQKIAGKYDGIGNFDHMLNCVEAICDCHDKLQLPKERLEKKKGKMKIIEREHE